MWASLFQSVSEENEEGVENDKEIMEMTSRINNQDFQLVL